ncbi:LPXTG cell wall anchor domain-containing protein [Candidatus Enterococcus courvalinii]|uniref:LPXTG cell wall anchor domain-containing protein n=1 Tax=Candidatus Enterococcus courvalinii TaxID=2815329 RepID=A0ABS3HYZ9_9ENTE|nr:LPXTG cell wall anchor domain-containing protein [Enterococcus sp. MSG2901]MBO0481688.1 LPXTG cell wall anchor domain-containing protein [Enterococcus sp. MSG2901]
MRNILKVMSVLLLFFCVIGITNETNAIEQNYDSTGQASFYGKYEYENTNDSNNSGSEWATGSNNYLSTGQVILPSTGDDTYPIFTHVGVILLIGVSMFIFMEKRKGDFDR